MPAKRGDRVRLRYKSHKTGEWASYDGFIDEIIEPDFLIYVKWIDDGMVTCEHINDLEVLSDVN